MHRVLATLFVSLLVGLLFAGPAAAHGDAQEDFLHLNVRVADLPPGEEDIYHLTSPEGPLRAGWIYIIYGGVQGGGEVVANLSVEGELTDRFVWAPGGFHKNSTKIQQTGTHDLVLWNPTNETVRYAFYYDQSCNCVGKRIPLPGGFVLFNNRFQEGRTVDYDLYVYDEAYAMKGALATHDDDLPTADWPEDFQILEEQTVQGKGWINFTFTPEETRTYYVFYEALDGVSVQSPFDLTPLIKVEDEAESPSPTVAFMLTLLVGLLAMARRRITR